MLSRAGGDWGLGEWLNPIGKATEFLDDLIQKIPNNWLYDKFAG